MKKLISVGIVGSRRRNTARDKELIRLVLTKMMNEYIIHVVSGGCPRGADSFAEELAEQLGLGISIHAVNLSELTEPVARWEYAQKSYERNTLIAEECHILLTTWDNISGGTKDTIDKVNKLGKPVVYL